MNDILMAKTNAIIGPIVEEFIHDMRHALEDHMPTMMHTASMGMPAADAAEQQVAFATDPDGAQQAATTFMANGMVIGTLMGLILDLAEGLGPDGIRHVTEDLLPAMVKARTDYKAAQPGDAVNTEAFGGPGSFIVKKKPKE